MATSSQGNTVIDFANAITRPDRQRNRNVGRRSCYLQLFAQVTNCVDEDLVGATLFCMALDASHSGLRLRGYMHLPENTKLDLWVESDSGLNKYFLMSEVRWVRDVAGCNFDMGVELQENPVTDIDSWRAYALST